MKNFLFVLLLTISIPAGAQEITKENSLEFNDLANTKLTAINEDLRRRTISDWYLPVNWAHAASPNGTLFKHKQSPLFPDSAVVNLVQNRLGTINQVSNNLLGAGCMFDPTDQTILFDPNNLEPLTQHQSYLWDSIFFKLGYIRTIDSVIVDSLQTEVVDTLFIRYYTFNTAGLAFLKNSNKTSAYPRKFNISTGIAESFARIDTLLLKNENATIQIADTWTTNLISLPVGFSTPTASGNTGNSRIGFTIDFKPQLSYLKGDTLANLTDSNISIANKYNYVVTDYFIDSNESNQQVPSDDHYNNSLFKDKHSRYDSILGYKPGNIFLHNQYFHCGFHISGSMNIIELDLGSIKIYPNPCKGKINFKILNNRSLQKIQLFNSLGQKYNVSKNFSNEVLDLSSFPKGIYYLQLQTEEGVDTQQITLI